MDSNTTTHPAKITDFVRFLDRNNIPYTMEVEIADFNDHISFYTIKSHEGSWFQSTITTMFMSTGKHTTEYGKRRISSVKHLNTWVGGLCGGAESKSVSHAYSMWQTYAVKGGE